MAPTAILQKARVRAIVPFLLLFLVFSVLVTSHASAYYDGLPAKQFQPDDPVADGDPDLPGLTDPGHGREANPLFSMTMVVVEVIVSCGLLGQ